ncbi:MAG: lipoyl(octanoyl) transferase LipB [Candidatus Tectomicrobia bacterium]|nr:lipoyl(octanoyl) transferase LipB [Candidatus Tectomicrobia bacterium]
MNICLLLRPGLIEYDKALAIQETTVEYRRRGDLPDVLFLLQHPPIITLGASGHEENILVSKDELATYGVAFCKTNRGGDVTYHGPGQLVGYPIFDLRRRGGDLIRFVRELEEVLIRTVRDYGIHAWREAGFPGVWTHLGKVAALGLRVRKPSITMHGFALNIAPNMEHFALIRPCGLQDKEVTSLKALLGSAPAIEEVETKIIEKICQIFHVEVREVEPSQIGIKAG